MSVHHMRHLFRVILACSALSGCGIDWKANTHPASGRVSVNGQAPAGAVVQLYPTGETKTDVRDSRPWGLVQDDGTFSLSTYEAGDGVPAGDYMFTITWPPDPSRPSMTDRLKFKYSRPDLSKWKFTIKKEKNALPPVEITHADVDMNPRTKSKAPMTGPAILGGAAKATRKSL